MLEQKPLRILEIGEFCLFKRNRPRETTFVFTGDNPRHLADGEFTPFGPAMLPRMLRSLKRGDWDIVFCFPRPRPLLDPRRSSPTSDSSGQSAFVFVLLALTWRASGIARLSSCSTTTMRRPCLDRRSSFSTGRLPISSASCPWIRPRHCRPWRPDIGPTSVLSPRVFFGATSTSSGRFLSAPRKIPFVWRLRRGRKNRLIYSSPGRQTIQ